MLVFISGRLINPVASESFVDGPLGVFVGVCRTEIGAVAANCAKRLCVKALCTRKAFSTEMNRQLCCPALLNVGVV